MTHIDSALVSIYHDLARDISNTYDEAVVDDVIHKTAKVYYPLLIDYEQVMQGLFNAYPARWA